MKQPLIPQPNIDTTFLTQMANQKDISEHLNRINQHSGPIYSSMTQDGTQSPPDNRTEIRQDSTMPGSRGDGNRRNETAINNDYALVPKGDDIYTKTMQSFKESMQGEDEKDKKIRREVQETQYMATNPQLTMNNGRMDDKAPEYVTFKRQNITRWGVVSQLI